MVKTIVSLLGAVCALAPVAAGLQTVQSVEEQPRYGVSFSGGSLVEYESTTINYARKEVDYYVNPYGVAAYPACKSNSCVVESGGNAIIYYDRIYDDLIPDYTYTYIFGKFVYGSYNDSITNMFNELYDLMGCDSEGTTVNGFKSGMKAYITKRNHTVTLTSATGSFYKINYNYIKEQLKQEKMAVVFMNGYAFVNYSYLGGQSGQDVYNYYVMTGRHSVLLYGYKDIYYYDAAENLIAYNSYFYATAGDPTLDTAYLSINHITDIEDAYIVYVQ